MNIIFKKGNWENKLNYAYTCRFPFTPKFIQEEDCIKNAENKEMNDGHGFDYTSLLFKKKYGVGTKITTRCSFEDFGAPLIVFPHDIWVGDEGELWYGEYHEIVLYEKGINVWRLYMEDGVVKYYKLMFLEFEVESNKVYELSATIVDKGLEVSLDDKKFYVRTDYLPAEVYVGISACEQINRFYNVEITE